MKTGEGSRRSSAVRTSPIHYDRTDPTSIVTDDSHTGRNVTLWIVAVKFVDRRGSSSSVVRPAADSVNAS